MRNGVDGSTRHQGVSPPALPTAPTSGYYRRLGLVRELRAWPSWAGGRRVSARGRLRVRRSPLARREQPWGSGNRGGRGGQDTEDVLPAAVRSATAVCKTVRMMHPRTAWSHSGTMAREPPTEALAALWAHSRRQERKVGIRYGAEAG
jgi:hypothetical protein